MPKGILSFFLLWLLFPSKTSIIISRNRENYIWEVPHVRIMEPRDRTGRTYLQ